MVDAALSVERNKRILSIQSHVVHGYAGNKASVFPLQLHGFEVDFINSVQFSNHAGNVEFLSLPTRYDVVKGQKLSDNELNDLFEGLKQNNIDNYNYILTGYCGNVSFLQKIADIVKELKAKDCRITFVCDPVMGDNGRYYTPTELLPVYRDVLLPMADIITPNAFELGELVGKEIKSEADCLAAIDELHAKGVKVIVVTSGVPGSQNEVLACYASTKESDGESIKFRFNFPRIRGQFVGTGDVFASLLVAWLDNTNGDLSKAVSHVLASLQALITRTSRYAAEQVAANSNVRVELRLIQSRKDLLVAEPLIEGTRIS